MKHLKLPIFVLFLAFLGSAPMLRGASRASKETTPFGTMLGRPTLRTGQPNTPVSNPPMNGQGSAVTAPKASPTLNTPAARLRAVAQHTPFARLNTPSHAQSSRPATSVATPAAATPPTPTVQVPSAQLPKTLFPFQTNSSTATAPAAPASAASASLAPKNDSVIGSVVGAFAELPGALNDWALSSYWGSTPKSSAAKPVRAVQPVTSGTRPAKPAPKPTPAAQPAPWPAPLATSGQGGSGLYYPFRANSKPKPADVPASTATAPVNIPLPKPADASAPIAAPAKVKPAAKTKKPVPVRPDVAEVIPKAPAAVPLPEVEPKKPQLSPAQLAIKRAAAARKKVTKKETTQPGVGENSSVPRPLETPLVPAKTVAPAAASVLKNLSQKPTVIDPIAEPAGVEAEQSPAPSTLQKPVSTLVVTPAAKAVQSPQIKVVAQLAGQFAQAMQNLFMQTPQSETSIVIARSDVTNPLQQMGKVSKDATRYKLKPCIVSKDFLRRLLGAQATGASVITDATNKILGVIGKETAQGIVPCLFNNSVITKLAAPGKTGKIEVYRAQMNGKQRIAAPKNQQPDIFVFFTNNDTALRRTMMNVFRNLNTPAPIGDSLAFNMPSIEVVNAGSSVPQLATIMGQQQLLAPAPQAVPAAEAADVVQPAPVIEPDAAVEPNVELGRVQPEINVEQTPMPQPQPMPTPAVQLAGQPQEVPVQRVVVGADVSKPVAEFVPVSGSATAGLGSVSEKPLETSRVNVAGGNVPPVSPLEPVQAEVRNSSVPAESVKVQGLKKGENGTGQVKKGATEQPNIQRSRPSAPTRPAPKAPQPTPEKPVEPKKPVEVEQNQRPAANTPPEAPVINKGTGVRLPVAALTRLKAPRFRHGLTVPRFRYRLIDDDDDSEKKESSSGLRATPVIPDPEEETSQKNGDGKKDDGKDNAQNATKPAPAVEKPESVSTKDTDDHETTPPSSYQYKPDGNYNPGQEALNNEVAQPMAQPAKNPMQVPRNRAKGDVPPSTAEGMPTMPGAVWAAPAQQGPANRLDMKDTKVGKYDAYGLPLIESKQKVKEKSVTSASPVLQNKNAAAQESASVAAQQTPQAPADSAAPTAVSLLSLIGMILMVVGSVLLRVLLFPFRLF